jgi:hypothetical protein
VSGICVLCKTEHLRIIAEAVLICGVGHVFRVGVEALASCPQIVPPYAAMVNR